MSSMGHRVLKGFAFEEGLEKPDEIWIKKSLLLCELED